MPAQYADDQHKYGGAPSAPASIVSCAVTRLLSYSLDIAYGRSLYPPPFCLLESD